MPVQDLFSTCFFTDKKVAVNMKKISVLILLACFSLGCQLSKSDYSSQYIVSYDQAEKLYEQKKYKESLELYNLTIVQAVYGIPEVFDSHLKMAQLHAFNKNFSESRRILKTLRFSVKKFADAEQKKSATLKISKVEAEIAKLESKKTAQYNRNYEDAYNQGIKEFEKKNYIAAYQILKRIPRYKDTQDYLSELEEHLEKANEDLFQQGFKLYAENRFKDAINIFNKVLSVNPEHENALDYREKAQKKLEVLEKIK